MLLRFYGLTINVTIGLENLPLHNRSKDTSKESRWEKVLQEAMLRFEFLFKTLLNFNDVHICVPKSRVTHMSAVPAELREGWQSLELELQEIVNCQMWVQSSARAVHLTADPWLQPQSLNVLQFEYHYLLNAPHTHIPGVLFHILLVLLRRRGTRDVFFTCLRMKMGREIPEFLSPGPVTDRSPWECLSRGWPGKATLVLSCSPHMTQSLKSEVEWQEASLVTLSTSYNDELLW